MRTKPLHAFQALLDELFRATGSHETLALPSAGYCRCAGLDVAICFDDSMGPSNIHAYIDFGRVAPARQSEVYRKLLLWNLRLAPKHCAVAGVDARTERVVLVAHIRFDNTLSGESLAATLRRLIQQADAWRTPAGSKAPAVRVGSGKSRSRRLLS